MASIKQKPSLPGSSSLPDFRNMGVIFRVLLVVNLLAALTALIRADDIVKLAAEMMMMAARVELPLFVILSALYMLAPWFARLSALRACALLASVVLASTLAMWPVLANADDNLWRWSMWAVAATTICLSYFEYRTQMFSPALTEARLLALTARIRPHFLFNSLNAVLGVIRSDPRRAEQGLEELADLFRVFMRDKRDLVPLGDEIALCERYINLETLRLGDKLRVRWDVAGTRANIPLGRVKVPPLLLQPLLENAVYHGIEPTLHGGEIIVRIGVRHNDLLLEVDNPVAESHPHHSGNKMALDNIRERLMLYYDLEADLISFRRHGRYRVRVRLPMRKSSR
ncbi:MAG: histidine kinase [Azoarcus sp.]|jgi:two-component system sensor histidine kinase AlgZ|nr:histidine kinase [Azoarcus sp.]